MFFYSILYRLQIIHSRIIENLTYPFFILSNTID